MRRTTAHVFLAPGFELHRQSAEETGANLRGSFSPTSGIRELGIQHHGAVPFLGDHARDRFAAVVLPAQYDSSGVPREAMFLEYLREPPRPLAVVEQDTI